MKIFRRVKTEDKLDLVLYNSSVKNPRAVIFLIHGMGEHAKRYAHVIEYFKNVNIATVAIELRGHGNSEGQRGRMASFFINIHQAGINAIARSKELEIPILLMHGSEDRLTSPGGSKDFHANAGSNVTFHLLEGLYHEVHNEPEKNQVFKIQFEWIEALLK